MKYIVVVGCGKSGKELSLELSKTENVVVVDKSLRNLDALGDDFNGKKLLGDALDVNTLEKAGIREANAVFILTGKDNINLVLGKVVKRKYGVKKVILRVNDIMKKKIFKEEGITIINSTYIIVEVFKKCIS